MGLDKDFAGMPHGGGEYECVGQAREESVREAVMAGLLGGWPAVCLSGI